MPSDCRARPTLTILGMPLNDGAQIQPEAIHLLEQASIVIAESRSVAMRYLKKLPQSETRQFFFLDPYRKDEISELKISLTNLGSSHAILFSDTGMPILFDPGKEILDFCLKLNFQIRSFSGPTSWGTACALCGFSPPFLLVGFPPQKREARLKSLFALKQEKAHPVLMDTPYRFTTLLSQANETFGQRRKAFLAWELDSPHQELLWGSLRELKEQSMKRNLKKGEFVLIIHGKDGKHEVRS